MWLSLAGRSHEGVVAAVMPDAVVTDTIAASRAAMTQLFLEIPDLARQGPGGADVPGDARDGLTGRIHISRR